MQKIDTSLPVPTPFRPNSGTNPTVEYEFKTEIFEGEDGTEQRWARRARPRVTIRFESVATTSAHVNACFDFMDQIGSSAMAIPDFRLTGSALAAPASSLIALEGNFCAWPVGTSVLIDRRYGLGGHVARVTSFDPVTGQISITPALPASGFVAGEPLQIWSCVSASPKDVAMTLLGPDALKVEVEAAIYPQETVVIGTVANMVFPAKHRDAAPITATVSKSVRTLDHGKGPVFEFLGEDAKMTGRRTYDLATLQFTQSEKEQMIRFFVACRGRCRSFTVPAGVIPGDHGASATRHRFASDILTVEHIDADKSKVTAKIVEVFD